jgi:hypothetical protein
MKKKIKLFLAIINLLITFFIFSNESNEIGKTTINKTSIKIGEKITINNELFNIENVKVLWKDAVSSDKNGEIISYNDYYKSGSLFLDVVITFFEPGEYENFYITIPLATDDDEIIYFYSRETTINVGELLTTEEKASIEKAEQIPQDLLRKDKNIAPFNFNIKPYIWIIVLVIIIVVIIIITIILIRKFIKKKKEPIKQKIEKREPYQEFLSTIKNIDFKESDDRVATETKLSLLTEALRVLIHEEFLTGAYSETTRELILSLRKINFNAALTNDINRIFTKLDMIKFAKAPFLLTELENYLTEIENLGGNIDGLYKQFKVDS